MWFCISMKMVVDSCWIMSEWSCVLKRSSVLLRSVHIFHNQRKKTGCSHTLYTSWRMDWWSNLASKCITEVLLPSHFLTHTYKAQPSLSLEWQVYQRSPIKAANQSSIYPITYDPDRIWRPFRLLTVKIEHWNFLTIPKYTCLSP